MLLSLPHPDAAFDKKPRSPEMLLSLVRSNEPSDEKLGKSLFTPITCSNLTGKQMALYSVPLQASF